MYGLWLLLMLMFDLLGRSVLLLLAFFGAAVKAEDQLNGGILRNIVIYNPSSSATKPTQEM